MEDIADLVMHRPTLVPDVREPLQNRKSTRAPLDPTDPVTPYLGELRKRLRSLKVPGLEDKFDLVLRPEAHLRGVGLETLEATAGKEATEILEWIAKKDPDPAIRMRATRMMPAIFAAEPNTGTNPADSASYTAQPESHFPTSDFSPIHRTGGAPVNGYAAKQAAIAEQIAEAVERGENPSKTLEMRKEGRYRGTGPGRTGILSNDLRDTHLQKANERYRQLIEKLPFKEGTVPDLEKIKLYEPDIFSDIQKFHEFKITLANGKEVQGGIVCITAKESLWVHPSNYKEILQSSFTRLLELRRFKSPGRKVPRTLDNAKRFANAAYEYYNAMPFPEGSAGTGNAWLAGEYRGLFGGHLKFHDGIDRYALSMSQSEFTEWYAGILMGAP